MRVVLLSISAACSGVIILTSLAQAGHHWRASRPRLLITSTSCVSTKILVLLLITWPPVGPSGLLAVASSGHGLTAVNLLRGLPWPLSLFKMR